MKRCSQCGAHYNPKAFAVCPRCKPMTFEVWGHGLDENLVASFEGKTVGEIIDKVLHFFSVTSEAIRAMRLDANGLIIKLKRPEGEDS